VSATKLYTLLRGKGIRGWRARKRPPLNAEFAEKRLAWAMNRKDWTAKDFEGFILSDECSVEKGKKGSTVWVFRSAAAGEEYLPECVEPQRYVLKSYIKSISIDLFTGLLVILQSWYGGFKSWRFYSSLGRTKQCQDLSENS